MKDTEADKREARVYTFASLAPMAGLSSLPADLKRLPNTDWAGLHAVLGDMERRAETHLAELIAIVEAVANGLYAADRHSLEEDMSLLQDVAGPVASLAEIVDRMREQLGLAPLDRRVSLEGLRASLVELRSEEERRAQPAPYELLRGVGAVGEAVEALVLAAGDAPDAAASAMGLVDLVQSVGDPEAEDLASELAESLLSSCAAWMETGVRPRSAVNDAIRRRLILAAPDELNAPDPEVRDSHLGRVDIRTGDGARAADDASSVDAPDDQGVEDRDVAAPLAPEDQPFLSSATVAADSDELSPAEGVGSDLLVGGIPNQLPDDERHMPDAIDDPRGGNDPGTPGADSSEAVEGVDRLAVEIAALGAGRLAIAQWAAEGRDAEGRAAAEAALCLAHNLRSGTGNIAAELQVHFARLDHAALAHRATAHLALAAALRTAVYAPSAELIRLVTDLRIVYAHHVATAHLLDGVLHAARSGAVIASASDTIRSVADREDAVLRAAAAALREMETGPTRTNRYQAATSVWQTWLRRGGPVGRLLAIAADDDRSRIEEVSAGITRLRDPKVIDREIRAADPRATKRNEITARARDRLLEWLDQALDIVGQWVQAARVATNVGSDSTLTTGVLATLRHAAERYDFNDALNADNGEPLAVACARVAGRSINETLLLYRSGAEEGAAEPKPEELLTDDLLFASGPVLVGGLPKDPPTLEQLHASLAADPDDVAAWVRAYGVRAGVRDHVATARIVDRLTRLDRAAGEDLANRRAVDLERAAVVAQREQRQVRDLLASARSHGHLDDADWSKLSGQVESLDPTGRSDIAHIVASLDEVRAELGRARAESLASLNARIEDAAGSGRVSADALERIRRRLDAADIATAEEYLALSLDGKQLPDAAPTGGVFDAWWPAVAKRAARVVIDNRLVHAANTGAEAGPISFVALDEVARREAAAGLRAWSQLAGGRPDGRLIEALSPVLGLLGVEALEASAVQGMRGQDREWRQLVGFRPIGRALVPDFGTQSSGAAAGDTLLLLLVWGSPRASTVGSWIASEQSSRPVMVWYLGQLDHGERLALAGRFRTSGRRRSVIVIDDSIIAHLASIQGRDYETLMRLTLPFSAVNPYQSVGGLTPTEMFYGRGLERASLQDPTGSALVYGGRQLGKSSLLRATERAFDDGHARRAIYLDLKAHHIGGTRPPDAIFGLLWNSLREQSLVRGEAPTAQIDQRFKAAVVRWLDERPGRMLLLLLDEADMFLEADARTKFATVTSLKGLMDDAARRVKFVFAGLHKVQRFKSVENQPFAHLGTPIAVGPLRAPEAMNLVSKPVEALGYRFEHPELPSRILAFCNSNPSLLVLFMQALLNRMLDQPLVRVGVERPPVIIADEDVEATYRESSVAERIRERFELTLDLDPAYKVIAYSVAHEAHERGNGLELSARELRELASGWWPKGFDGLSSDGFRALCDELVDLGVLAYRRGNYGLRSPNILRFLGSSEQIADVLLDAERLEPSPAFEATSARSRLKGERDVRSPLTAAQVTDLLAPRNQVRLVLGSKLAGIERVADALRSLAATDITVEEPDPAETRLGSFRNTTGRHRVLVLNLDGVALDRAKRLVLDALERPGRQGTLGIVFLASPANLALCRAAVGGGDPWDRLGTIASGPVDAAAWRYWIHDGDLPFADDAGRLLDLSGGWLEVLEQTAETGRARGRAAAISELDQQAVRPGNDLLSRAGLTGNLLAAFREICAFCGDGDSRDSLIEAASLAGGDDRDVDVLLLLGVLRADRSGSLKPDALLASALQYSV